MSQRSHQFGGRWTTKKLLRVRQYLHRYVTALKNQPFEIVYVDAFAGTGYRTNKADASSLRSLFGVPEINDMATGSAWVALEISPSFDEYYLIEKNRSKFRALKELASEFPRLRERVTFVNEDANTVIRRLCDTIDWRRTRAVMFLDPNGMQVDWSTIETIAGTKAIDLWYLFATDMGLNRLLTRSGNIPPVWQAKLDRQLGYPGWRDVFYEHRSQNTLFQESVTTHKKIYSDALAERFILGRLRQVFAGVADRGLPLHNSKGQCMYLLTFACGNERGARVALPIAEHILKS